MLPQIAFFIVTAVVCDHIATRGRNLLGKQVEEMSKSASMEAEINAAAEMQQSALPANSFRTAQGEVQIQAFMRPAKAVGGDFYDYFMEDDNLVFTVADVSDKGFGAALFMMKAKNAVRTAFQAADSFEDAVAAVNSILCGDNEESMFVTMWIGCMNIHTGLGKYANCGHNMPILKHADGSCEPVENEPDFMLGVFDPAEISSHVLKMASGDTLTLYTDGLTDAMNEAGEAFGDERLLKVIEGMSKDAPEPCDYLLTKVDEFVGASSQFDDMTSIRIHFNQPEAETVKTISCETTMEATEHVLDQVNQMLEKRDCPENVRRNIDVSIDEVCENIREYAYEDGTGSYEVTAAVGRNYVRLEFVDQGMAFNPLEDAEDPLFEDL